MEKNAVRQTMLALEQRAYEASRESYLRYFSAAHVDGSEVVTVDERAQAEHAHDLAEAFDEPVHLHADKVARLRTIDFRPKIRVEEGAIAKINGRYVIVAVATDRFDCEGQGMIGISTDAPIYRAIEGAAAGAVRIFNGHVLKIDEVL